MTREPRRSGRRLRPGPEAIDVPDDERWNHNSHYHPVLLKSLPPDARSALDVGCGEGSFTRQLRARVPSVVGIDTDADSIALATAQGPADVSYVRGDLLTYPFEDESFDVVASVTTLHHLDQGAALAKMAALVKPGGVLAIVGVARRRWPHDLPWDVAGTVGTRPARAGRAEWTTPAPKVWPPPLTFALVRTGARILAGRPLPATRAVALLARVDQAAGLRLRYHLTLAVLAIGDGGGLRRRGVDDTNQIEVAVRHGSSVRAGLPMRDEDMCARI